MPERLAAEGNMPGSGERLVSPHSRRRPLGRAGSGFDGEFFRRFYLDPESAVTSRGEMDARGRLIAAFAGYMDVKVRRILDAGCGLGLLRRSLVRALPGARYVGLEVSSYLCRRYGWTRGSLADWTARGRFDLVVCYDVLQYLDDRAAIRALANLGRLCRGILYFSALTREDWLYNCDRRRTDPDVHLRPAAWYRQRLAPRFRESGAGLWVRRGLPTTLWSLESAPDPRGSRSPVTARKRLAARRIRT
jgi:SAM-dependent methyltransferase